jgi:hypothetical protein
MWRFRPRRILPLDDAGSPGGREEVTMATFLIHNRHQAAECPVLDEEYQAMGGVPAALRGHEYFCTCPTGDHGAYVVVDGDSADQVLAMLPPKYRAGTRVIGGVVLELQYMS